MTAKRIGIGDMYMFIDHHRNTMGEVVYHQRNVNLEQLSFLLRSTATTFAYVKAHDERYRKSCCLTAKVILVVR